VLSALRDVEDALSGIRLTAMQQEALAEALRRNSQLLEMSQRIYQRGALDYVSLLDTQRDVFQAQDAEASARFEQIRSSVDLFKALGGGIAPENDPCIARSDKP
jgi:outer membrane protein TolC